MAGPTVRHPTSDSCAADEERKGRGEAEEPVRRRGSAPRPQCRREHPRETDEIEEERAKRWHRRNRGVRRGGVPAPTEGRGRSGGGVVPGGPGRVKGRGGGEVDEPVRRPCGGRRGVMPRESVKNEENRKKPKEIERNGKDRGPSAQWSARPCRRDRPAAPSRSRVAWSVPGRRFAGPLRRRKGRERRRGRRTGSATAWRLEGVALLESVKNEGNRTKPNEIEEN